MSRFAFALKPKWILGHVIVLALIVGFVNAGLWQIRRLHQRQSFNHEIIANMHAPVSDVDDVLPASATFKDVPGVLDRRITATGHYLIDSEIVITAQANPQEIPGVWIVSPLLLGDGRVLLVNRGWLPSTGQITRPPVDARPPSGQVTVSGFVSETQAKTEGESAERNETRQENFLRIDIARIQKQFPQTLLPAFLQRTGQRPADPGSMVPQNLAPPVLTNGPHLSYTIQWFSFTVVAVAGYSMLLWISARDRDDEDDDGEGGDKEGGPPDDLPPGAFIDADGTIDMTEVEDATSDA